MVGVTRGEVPLHHAFGNQRGTARGASHGWSLDGIEIVELIAEEHDLDGENQVTMYPRPRWNSRDDETNSGGRRKDNPTRIVFDSLSEMRLLAQNSFRYRRQILALKQFFIGRKCTVLLLDDRTSEGPTCSCRASRTA